MTDTPYVHLEFPEGNKSLHSTAAQLLLSKKEHRYILKQGLYSYKIEGGTDGCLYYRKGSRGEWIDIARWAFYGGYLRVLYRKPFWLQPMYESLLTRMNFTSVRFGEHTISVTDTEGNTIHHKRFRLIPPGAMTKVLVDKFHFTQERADGLMNELNLSGA
jgi:hypothetical protein